MTITTDKENNNLQPLSSDEYYMTLMLLAMQKRFRIKTSYKKPVQRIGILHNYPICPKAIQINRVFLYIYYINVSKWLSG
jgi:hypothetical protein